MRRHSQQQRLERLSAAEQSDVRGRSGRQQAAERVEGLGANRGPVHAVRVGGRFGIFRAEVRFHPRNPARVGRERGVERAHELVSHWRASDLRRHVEFPLPVRTIGVRHVTRRLLEIRHQASPLEHLGQDVRRAFARHVRAAELRDRIVAVLAEHARIQPIGPLDADLGCLDTRASVQLAGKFVEEQPPQ